MSFCNPHKDKEKPKLGPWFSGERTAQVILPRGSPGVHLVVITMDYKKAPDDILGANRILFTGKTPGNEGKRLEGDALNTHNLTHEDEATFVKQVKHISGPDEDGKREYEGIRISPADAKKEYETHFGASSVPLFFLHGYNNEPGYVLNAVKDAQQKFDNAKTGLIPVLWPCYGTATSYSTDRVDNAPEAAYELYMGFGKVLENTTFNVFPNKNLLCHSMGNYVVRKAAPLNKTGIEFDNIFMCSADVRHNIFHHDYINRGDGEEKDGLKIFNLLKKSGGQPTGKIYILYNDDDYALEQSTYTGGNWVNRLGQVGNGTYDSWWPGWYDDEDLIHGDIKGHTENYNAGAKLSWGDFKAHSYHFMDFAIDYYKSKL